jgi:hypothetical protein
VFVRLFLSPVHPSSFVAVSNANVSCLQADFIASRELLRLQVEENLRLKIELEAQKLYWQTLVVKLEALEMQVKQSGPSPPVVPPAAAPVNAQTVTGASTDLEDHRRQLAERIRLYSAETIRVAELTSRLEASERARAEAEQDKESALLLSVDQQSFTESARISELTAELAGSEKARVQAEKDKDFFLDLYHQSSAYVTTVREENCKLLERAEIAEGQVKYGLEMAKATFQKTLEKMEKDAEHHKQVAAFLIEKDRRTSEEIRLRALEEPELRMQIGALRQQLRLLTKEASEINEALEEEREERDCERAVWAREKRENDELLAKWKEEMFSVNVELDESLAKLANVQVGGTGGPADEMAEMVYRCRWRAEDGEKCSEVLSTKTVGVSLLSRV